MTGAGLQAGPQPVGAVPVRAAGGRRGSAVVATMEGSRPMLVEVQALVSPTSFGKPRRMSIGLDANRTDAAAGGAGEARRPGAPGRRRVRERGGRARGDGARGRPGRGGGGGLVVPQPAAARAQAVLRRGGAGGRGARRGPGRPAHARGGADGLHALHLPARNLPGPSAEGISWWACARSRKRWSGSRSEPGMRSFTLGLALLLTAPETARRRSDSPLDRLPPNVEMLTHFGERADISPGQPQRRLHGQELRRRLRDRPRARA